MKLIPVAVTPVFRVSYGWYDGRLFSLEHCLTWPTNGILHTNCLRTWQTRVESEVMKFLVSSETWTYFLFFSARTHTIRPKTFLRISGKGAEKPDPLSIHTGSVDTLDMTSAIEFSKGRKQFQFFSGRSHIFKFGWEDKSNFLKVFCGEVCIHTWLGRANWLIRRWNLRSFLKMDILRLYFG